MARLVANLPVLKAGFPPIVIPAVDRYRYKTTLSAYQNTVAALANLDDLASLPDNGHKHRFVALCVEYWAETLLALVVNARKMQDKRLQ